MITTVSTDFFKPSTTGETTIQIIRGLPGSGKSTLANKMLDSHTGIVIINKDSIRAAIHNGQYDSANELVVRAMQKAMIQCAIANRQHILVDDAGTLKPETLADLVAFLEASGVKSENITVNDKLLSVPLAVCLKQNLKRLNSVPEQTIRQMAARYLPRERAAHDPAKPDCYVFDIDGCLGDMCDRHWSDWSKAHLDEINPHVAAIMASVGFSNGESIADVIVLTGREATPENNGREIIIEWLDTKFVVHSGDDFLITRKEGDRRPAAKFKGEELEKLAKKYNIMLLVDDDATVIDVAQEMGIPTIQTQHLGRSQH